MNHKRIRITLAAIEAFIGLGAVGGGIAILTGAFDQWFPVAWLQGTPFNDYLIPGLVLRIVVGGGMLLAAIMLFTRRNHCLLHSGGRYCVTDQEQAGADALELNIYSLPTDPKVSSAELEAKDVLLVREVRAAVKIPFAVKLSPFFTSLPNVAQRFVEAGANGLVLFNRFYQPDFDLETLEVAPNLDLSTSRDLRLPLRWIALLYGRIHADFALTSGVHTAQDVLKAMMAGASMAMMASALLEHGPELITRILKSIGEWMTQREYESLSEMKGSIS